MNNGPSIQGSVERAIKEYNENLWQTLGGMSIPGTKYPIDSWLFAILMGERMANAQPHEVDQMRVWSLDQWKDEIDLEIERRSIALGIDPLGIDDPDIPPPWMSRREILSHRQARHRSGELITTLGDFAAQSAGEMAGEIYEGEQASLDSDAIMDKDVMDVLSTELAETVARGRTADQLATQMGVLTKKWDIDWTRISRTELQGVYNEGVAMEALEVLGEEAQVARTPDQTACVDCRRVFLRGDTPIVFKVTELISNDTNAGKKRLDWLPTLWPVHPNCRCGTQVIPPGFTMNDEWDVVPLDEESEIQELVA